jgi:hypothetical protein
MIKTIDLDDLESSGLMLGHLKEDQDFFRIAVNGRCFIENAGMWYGLHDIQGYDPLILKRYMNYINKSQDIPPDNKVVNMHYIRDFDNNLINMLNLKYVVDCGSRKILLKENFIPRAYIVRNMVLLEDNQILDYMMLDDFNPLEKVILNIERSKTKFAFTDDPESRSESYRIVEYDNDRVVIIAEMDEPGFLIMSEISYPGWHAYVNGEKREILTGNYLFRTLWLDSGKNLVLYKFESMSFKMGMIISFISVLGCILAFIFLKRNVKSNET